MSNLKLSLYFRKTCLIALALFFTFNTRAESSESEPPDPDFLEFLADIVDETGDDGFETWLKANSNDEDTEEN